MKLKKGDIYLQKFLRLNPKNIFVYGVFKNNEGYLVLKNNEYLEFPGGLRKKNEDLFRAIRLRYLENGLIIDSIKDLIKYEIFNNDLYAFFEIKINNLKNKNFFFSDLKENNLGKSIKIFLKREF